MSIDPTITVGNILTILAMLGGGFVFLWKMSSKLDVFSVRLSSVEVGMSQVTLALVQLAKQEARLDAHADRIGRLEQEQD